MKLALAQAGFQGCLRPRGKLIVIETLGTGFREPQHTGLWWQ
jgi:hypothetical protein